MLRFGSGTCTMQFDEANLVLQASAPSPQELTSLQDVISSHLARFATQAELVISRSSR